jgi:YD repeat-containing protein
MKPWQLLLCALFLWIQPAVAKKEYREIAWAWCLYDCGNSGDFDSPQAVLDKLNADVNQQYDQCVAATSNCQGSCYKVNRYNLAPAGGFAIVNGISTFQNTRLNISTSFVPACGSAPAQTTVGDPGGGVAVYGKTLCPSGDWSEKADNVSSTIVDGVQTPTSTKSCQAEIPDPPPVQPKPKATPYPEARDDAQACKIRVKPLLGDPISPVDGVHVEAELDYSSSDGLLNISRYYTSGGGGRWIWGDVGMSLSDFTGRWSGSSAGAPLMAEVNLIPPGIYWSGTRPPAVPVLKSFALLRTQPAASGEVSITLKDGRRVVFLESSPGVFSTSSVSKESLSVSTLPDGSPQWVLTTAAGEYVFDASGRVVQRVSPGGLVRNYQYQAGSVTVTSLPSMRNLVYTRDVLSPRISSATLPDGQVIGYTVDTTLRVRDVTYADGTVKSYRYAEPEHMGGASRSGWLTGIVDEKGVRTVTLKFNGSLALSTERAGGVDKYSVTYSASTSQVTPPNGGSAFTFSWDTGPDGERRLASQSQPAGAGCAASSSSRTFDTNGGLASSNDFNGNRTCFANDPTRNLELVRVDGLAGATTCSAVTPAGSMLPAGSRKVQAQWHPDWPIKVRLAEPGRITTSVYNGQPDPFNGNTIASCAPANALLPDGKPIAVLCRQVEQATTDANGAAGFSATLQAGVANRVTTWTYNQWGQMLTHDGPRTDVNDITTYAYYSDTSFAGSGAAAEGHSVGDLQSVTNAAGQVTLYTKYNKHGQLLESSDANGVVTTNTYDLRQRLLSTTVGGLTTSYTYDPVGQLKRVTLPDASWMAYDYDDAHRQVAVYDHLGNRIEYVLDNAGNRTTENLKDPSGHLKRQLTRSFDALGRVQQTVGQE